MSKLQKNILSICCIFALIVGGVSAAKNKPLIIKTWQFDTISKIENFFGKEYYASRAQYIPIYRFLFSIRSNSLARQQIIRLLQTIKGTNIDSCQYTSSTIVLIIGESYNKHHSQLYGYSLPTTPKQYERFKNNELFVFRDAITPYNITSDVFKNLFSLNDLSKQEEWYEKPLFTVLFRKAQYHVSFISNEFVLKQNENFADFSGGMFINNPTVSEQQFNSRNTTLHQYDEYLINDYKLLNDSNNKNNLIIFSLMGQHVDYKDQYPPQYVQFTAKDYKRNDLKPDEIQIIANYDNATWYNDYVVNSILELFDNDNAIVIYMPDHGEECFDEIRIFGRQHYDIISKEMAKNEFQIPFWIWCSKAYRDSHQNIIKLLENSTNRPFINDHLAHLLLYLAGIHCKDYQDELNIISPNYKVPKRLIRGVIDYDKLMQE